MELTAEQSAFLAANRTAAMITIGKDGRPKPIRIAYQVVDGRIWSSGTDSRVRTKRLREDPRCTLFVWEPQYHFLVLETTVTILDGSEAPDLNLRYFRQLLGTPEGPITWSGAVYQDDEAFRAKMVEQGRLIYEFAPLSAYGSF